MYWNRTDSSSPFRMSMSLHREPPELTELTPLHCSKCASSSPWAGAGLGISGRSCDKGSFSLTFLLVFYYLIIVIYSNDRCICIRQDFPRRKPSYQRSSRDEHAWPPFLLPYVSYHPPSLSACQVSWCISAWLPSASPIALTKKNVTCNLWC